MWERSSDTGQDPARTAVTEDIQFEFGVQEPGQEPDSEPRWLLAAVAAIGVLVLVAVVALLPGDPDRQLDGPDAAPAPSVPTPSLSPTSTPGPGRTPDPATGPDRAEVQTDPVLRFDPAVGSAEVGQPGAADNRVALLVDTTDLQSRFSLVELSERSDGEQSVRLVGLEGRSRALDQPVYFRSTNWPTWPGASHRPFVTAGSHLVYLSRGEVVVASLTGDDQTSIGEGVTVLDGSDDDEFWVIGADSRWITNHRIGALDGPGRRISMAEAGRPLAAVDDGLVVVPKLTTGAGPLAVWRPDQPMLPLDVPAQFGFLGAAADRVVTGDRDRLLVFDTASGRSTETMLDQPLDMHRVSLSPDGALLALSQDHEVTSLGRLVVVDTRSGQTVAELQGFVDREFAWTSDQTIVTLVFQDGEFFLIEFDVITGRQTLIASVRYPWVYVATAG